MVAETHVDVVRVRQTKRDVIAPALAHSAYWPRKARARLPSRKVLELMHGPPTPEKLAFVIADLSDDLGIMDRYERRALSPRKWAIRNLDDVLADRETDPPLRLGDDGRPG